MRGGLFSGLNAGLKSGLGGGMNVQAKAKKPVLGVAAGMNKALGGGDFTIEDKRLNKGMPTNVPSVYNGQQAPFPRNDPRFRDWIVKNALKSRQKYRSFANLQEAMSAARTYGQQKV